MSDMQKELDEIYKSKLNKTKLKNDFTIGEQCKLSAPFLINIPKNYSESKLKILYIGKETNIWWGKLKHFIDLKDSVDILKTRHYAEFNDCEVVKSSDPRETKKYKGRDWGNNKFFSKYSFFEKNIPHSSIIWTNLLKMDSGVKGYAKNSIDNDMVKEYSRDILLDEIEALEPDVIIFVTATVTNLKKYDTAIKDTFENNYTNSKVIESGKLWIFEYKGIKCYRTLHPSSYHFRKIKQDYYQDIVNDINNNFQLFNNGIDNA